VFERFTDSTRRVVVLAQEEARHLNHNYIGTEHLLLGLMAEGKSPAALALDDLGYTREAVRGGVDEILGRGQVPTSKDPVPFSPRAKKILELSLRESLALSHPFIGPEHLLLGLLREREGVGAQILVAQGPSLEVIRQRVLERVGTHPASVTARQFTSGERTGATRLEEILNNLERRLEAIEIRLSALEDRLDG
jgi:ATP-dependent Clp protease ATP-binding subunit ClpC